MLVACCFLKIGACDLRLGACGLELGCVLPSIYDLEKNTLESF